MSQVLHFIEKLWEIYVKRFHLNNAILSFGIIILAWIMDIVLALYACPLCILTRYVFGTFGFFSLIAAFNDSFKNLQNIFIFGSLFFGVGEWGLIFFLIFIFVNLLNVFKVLKKV